MMTRVLRIACFACLVLLAGCSSLAPLLTTPTPAPVPQAVSTPEVIPTSTAPATMAPRLLRIWVPSQFDPHAGTSHADLLQQRLLAFENKHPDIRLEVRVKSYTDILTVLSVTGKAAPEAMPDLIALSHFDMQNAASAGFLHPLDGLTTLLQDPDWYAFARELARMQNIEYGIPFASDVLLTVYRPAVFTEPPSSWSALFESGTSMAFPVSDPNALFSLSLYLSVGGQLTGDQGKVELNEDVLVRLLSFHKQALETGTLPPAVRDHKTDAQSLQLYREGSSDLVVLRASSDALTLSGRYSPLLGLDDIPYSLGDGWVWALAGSDLENQILAVELASYLVESEFMSGWTRAAGLLPTRPQALMGWGDENLEISLGEVLQSAHPLPSEAVMSVVSPLLREAVIRVWNGEQPEVAARSVVEELE